MVSSLLRLGKAAMRLGKWIKGGHVIGEFWPLTPGHLLCDSCVNRSEVLNQETLVSLCELSGQRTVTYTLPLEHSYQSSEQTSYRSKKQSPTRRAQGRETEGGAP